MRSKNFYKILSIMAVLFVTLWIAVPSQKVEAAEQVKIEISYIYVNDSGDNSLFIDIQYVPVGTTWGTFFATYEKCYENQSIKDASADNEWEISVQNVRYRNEEDYYSKEIRNFNKYLDCALVTFYGYPETYKHGYFSFEFFKNDKIEDSGTGWDLLMPRAYTYGSEEALAYVRKNAEIYEYIKGLFKTGSTIIVEAPYSSDESGTYWDGYNLNISVTIPPEEDCFAKNEGYHFYETESGDVVCFSEDGSKIIDEFKCDGTYTYYFQADGTAMRDRLTYHPDGVHVIYFDESGHEIFSDFANVKKTIAGEEVDDYCFFDVFGYLYVDVVTYDKTGTYLYYANPYGVMDKGKWFEFSDSVKWADGTPFDKAGGKYGYANEDGTLMTNQWTYDWEGRKCYMQGNGVALY